MSEEDNIRSEKFAYIAWTMLCIVLFTCAWILGGTNAGNSCFILALVVFYAGSQSIYARKFTRPSTPELGEPIGNNKQ